MATVPIIRTSERTSLKRCPQQWWWGYREGLRPKQESYGALWFGIGIHLVFEHWYGALGLKRGARPLGVWRDYVNRETVYVRTKDPDMESKIVDAAALGEEMIKNYLDRYGKDERWDVVSVEHPFRFPVRSPNGKLLVVFASRWDLVARDRERNDELWLWDHKTAAQIMTQHLPMDDQAGGYWAVANDTMKEEVRGILYNFLRKGTADDRPRDPEGRARNKPKKKHYIEALDAAGVEYPTKLYKGQPIPAETEDQLAERADAAELMVFGDVSENQGSPLFLREEVTRTRTEKARQIERIAGEAQLAEAYRTRQLPIIKVPTKDCAWGCDFYRMCELHEQGADWEEYRDARYRVQDPYAEHRGYVTK